MTVFPINFYNIHNLLEIRVENLDLKRILSYFSTERGGGNSDLTIKVGGFDPKPTHSKLWRFHLGQNVIVEKRKFGSIQLSDVLGKTELNVTRGYVRLRPFPCLIENIMGWKLLIRNHALVHSSCISEDGKGYLICGWQGAGKTMVALKFAKERGFNFLSDDLTIVSGSGQAYCFPKDIELRSAHNKVFKLSKKMKLKLLLRELMNKSPVHIPYPKRPEAQISEMVEDSTIEEQCKIHKVIMLQQAQQERIAELNLDEAVRRLILLEEWALTFWVERLFIPYAYCDPKFDLQNLWKREREILKRALKGVPCYEVRFRKFAYNIVKTLTD